MDYGYSYQAATNPVLAVRLSGAPRLPRRGVPEELVWKESLNRIELAEAVYNTIVALPDRLRDVIEARFGRGMKLEEVGGQIGRTKERVRQLEGIALRMMRSQLGTPTLQALGAATEVVALPGSSLDPDWLTTRQAQKLTGYCRPHLRWLCRQRYVVCQINPLKRSQYQISRTSLEAYVKARPGDGRKKGQWKEDHNG